MYVDVSKMMLCVCKYIEDGTKRVGCVCVCAEDDIVCMCVEDHDVCKCMCRRWHCVYVCRGWWCL